MSLRRMVAWLETKTENYKATEEKDKTRLAEILMIKKFPTLQDGPYIKHPSYDSHLKTCSSNFGTYLASVYTKDKDRTWAIGDSITQFSKNKLTSVNPLMNMALAGMWVHHMKKLAEDIIPVMKVFHYTPNYILVGTPGGNNILWRQKANITIKQFIELLDYLRTEFPKAKIIVNDLPATINAYAISIKPYLTEGVFEWVKKDKNAVILLMIKKFTRTNQLLPKSDTSCEGIHLTPLGQVYYDEDIIEAKTTKNLFIA
jgi:hypothetical protein